jgi:lipopolysaccharide biosynthesis glycosyltransferase
MKAHFVITTSATEKMELQVEVLIRSIKRIGRCPDSFFTIFSHEHEKISNAYIKQHEVLGHEKNPNLKYPWSVCARWNVTPKADTIIGLDADVVALRDLNPLLEELQAKKGMSGTIACSDDLPIEKWKRLFALASIDFPEKTYVTARGQTCPYYINNGVLALSSEYVVEIRHATKKMIELINLENYDDFFITQRANTLAAYACNVPLNVMSKDFNHLEVCYGQPNRDTYFFHYNNSKAHEFFNPFNFLSLLP